MFNHSLHAVWGTNPCHSPNPSKCHDIWLSSQNHNFFVKLNVPSHWRTQFFPKRTHRHPANRISGDVGSMRHGRQKGMGLGASADTLTGIATQPTGRNTMPAPGNKIWHQYVQAGPFILSESAPLPPSMLWRGWIPQGKNLLHMHWTAQCSRSCPAAIRGDIYPFTFLNTVQQASSTSTTIIDSHTNLLSCLSVKHTKMGANQRIFLITTSNHLTPQWTNVSSRPTPGLSTISTPLPHTQISPAPRARRCAWWWLGGCQGSGGRQLDILQGAADHLLSGLPLFRLQLGLTLVVELGLPECTEPDRRNVCWLKGLVKARRRAFEVHENLGSVLQYQQAYRREMLQVRCTRDQRV